MPHLKGFEGKSSKQKRNNRQFSISSVGNLPQFLIKDENSASINFSPKHKKRKRTSYSIDTRGFEYLETLSLSNRNL